MRDPRALASWNNLMSYRAWEREGFLRSGMFAFVIICPLLTPALTWTTTLLGRGAGAGRTDLMLIEAIFAAYLALSLGAGLWAVLRLKAWKRAHPWEPPARGSGRRHHVGRQFSPE